MKKYRELGIKLTPQRLAILEFLDMNLEHPSAEEIYKKVRKKYPMMSFATVYNTLQALANKRNINELTIDPDRRRYDSDTGYHHHLICNGCKKILDIHADFPVNIADEEKGSFDIIGNHIEFYGICPVCKDKEEE